MATGHKNNKSTYKGIRFPNELIEKIETEIKSAGAGQVETSFSAWVLDACEKKLIKSDYKK